METIKKRHEHRTLTWLRAVGCGADFICRKMQKQIVTQWYFCSHQSFMSNAHSLLPLSTAHSLHSYDCTEVFLSLCQEWFRCRTGNQTQSDMFWRTHAHTHTSELSYDLIHCLMHYAHDVHTGECTHWYKHRHSHSAFSFFLAWRFTHLSITGPHEIIIAASHTRSPIPSCRDLSI